MNNSKYMGIINYIVVISLIFLITLTNFSFAESENNKYKRDDINTYEIKLEDGFYEVPISLWNAVEDKESMGNKALNNKAEIEVKDNKAYLYLRSDKLEYLSIVTTLVNLYIEKEDGNFYPAERSSYTLEIPKEKEKRPEIFKTSLLDTNEFINVYVDPKVEPMGDEPIKARLKLDFNNLKKIDYKDSVLINKFNNGPKKSEFDTNKASEVQNKNIFLKYDANTFDKDFDFYGNKLSGDEVEKILKDFSTLDVVNVYKIEFLGPIKKISKGEKDIQSKREKIIPKKDFEIKLPLGTLKKDDNLKVYDYTEGKKEIPYSLENEHLIIKAKNPGNLVIVKSNDTSGVKIQKSSTDIKQTPIKSENSFLKSVTKRKAKKLNKVNNPVTSLPIEETTEKSEELPQVTSTNINENSRADKKNIEDKIPVEGKQDEINETRESAGIIFLIVIAIITINTFAFIFIRRYTRLIQNLKEEEKYIDDLRRKNEK